MAERASCKVFVDEGYGCPRCGSWDFDGGSPTFDGPKVFQECRCCECGYTWDDVYTYSHSLAERLPESEEGEIQRRIVELSAWPMPCFPHAGSPEEVTVLESFAKGGSLVSAVVRVRGLGYSVNFEEGSCGRDTAYDLHEKPASAREGEVA